MLDDPKSEKASVTLITLCLCTAMAIALASYVALCQSSYSFSTRVVNLNSARELAQVGLEEALWALNQNAWTTSGSTCNQSWSTSGANRTITLNYDSLGQGSSGQVAITILNYASAGPTWPTITSAATLSVGDGSTMTKTLQASTGPAPLFGNAIASAGSYVSFVTGGTVDSWNSHPGNNPSSPATAYSFTAGTPSNYAAVVAGNSDGAYGVLLNQAQVNGYVATFGTPVSFSTSGSPNGMVQGPSTAAGTNVDPARIGQSAYIPASSVFGVTIPPASGPNFGGILGDVLSLVSALLGAPSTAQVYVVNGDLTILGIPLLSPNLTVDNRAMTLIVEGNLTIGGAGKIIVNSNASLELIVTGNVSIGGSGIQNLNLDPSKAAIFCTNGSTTNTVQYTSSSDFYGVIYSQNMPIDIRQNANFYGALLSGQYVRFSTSATAPKFHYDTWLRNVRFADISTPYVVNQLTEL